MQGLLLSGRYRLADAIGSGGMGRVWRAHDEVLHRAVAIKELTAALYVAESDQEVLLARTRAEARAAARINHSAVVTVHDVLEHDGRPWIVMELVEGRSLADALKDRDRMDPAEAARIGLWVLRALRAAHAAGVLHRDVKPGNVLLGEDGRVLLTDFGIAQIEGDTTITRTGEVVGSVDYLAPERVRGHDPGPASDLWALGATLYTAVEGLSPFRRTSPLSTMQAVVDEEPREPRHAGPLAPVITALLRKDPAERPQAEEAEQMLAEAAEGRRPSSAQAYVPTQAAGLPPETAAHAAAYPASGSWPPATTPYPAPAQAAIGPMPQHPAVRMPRRRRTLILVVALAALVGGGSALMLQKWDQDRRQDSATSPSTPPPETTTPSTPSSTTDASGGLPDGWVRVRDPYGFSLAVPDETWQREVFDEATHQVDYTPDGGKHFIRVAVENTPDFSTAHEHQLYLEQRLQRLVDYRRVGLEPNTYRDCPGSRWEYTWTALAKDTPFPGPRHAVEETYFSREGVEYAIYMSSPEEDWTRTRQQFQTVLQSWQPAAG
ncbi:serine/threonine-protein kinase [Streptomyces sp. CB01373]|uniref:serine/threonine-protein kinase n=1 Tax=Streptomyces sp. CB01373 TaxID=2020325 RepID=UPI000C27BCB3|nr:serine/threonine-protein kinase [Streptomyces sp. CB01373]PJM94255.1 serine/threonine protein kinase [Streptomyces sp. CB01373]